jgi:hypothetical protein
MDYSCVAYIPWYLRTLAYVLAASAILQVHGDSRWNCR